MVSRSSENGHSLVLTQVKQLHKDRELRTGDRDWWNYKHSDRHKPSLDN